MMLRLVAVLLMIWSAPALASSRVCVDAYGKAEFDSWDQLPNITDREVSPQVLKLFLNHPLAYELRARYGAGQELTFRTRIDADNGGWTIQGRYLQKVIKAIFPKATFSRDNGQYPIGLKDTTLQNLTSRIDFDLSDLKILNTGVQLPSRKTLRANLGLPPRARIVSVYASWKREYTVGRTMRELFATHSASIVVLSLQAADMSIAAINADLSRAKIPLYTSREWIARPSANRLPPAVILNQTRERLPYIHAAADYAIVLGPANILEPLQAGRPTYFEESANEGKQPLAWKRLADIAIASGAGSSFTTDQELTQLLRVPPAIVSPKIAVVDQEQAVDNLMQALRYLLYGRGGR